MQMYCIYEKGAYLLMTEMSTQKHRNYVNLFPWKIKSNITYPRQLVLPYSLRISTCKGSIC